MMDKPVIEASGLRIGYIQKKGRQKIIHDSLDLSLYPGEVTCLLGLNGAGKSTLLRTLCGFQPPLSGSVQLMGQPLDSYSPSRISLTVGVVLTEKTNAGGITAYELVSLGRYPYTGFFGRLKQNDHCVIEQSLKDAGIAHKGRNYVSELSDGERQKVLIAKALAQECPVIILDEPTAFLDVNSRIETMVLLRKLAVEQGKAVLLSTHDLDLAIQMGDRLWLQSREKPMLCGTPEDLILKRELETFFDKDGLLFDSATGKLHRTTTTKPIGVEGDPLVSYWVGNALLRQGYHPSAFDMDHLNIQCISPDNLIVSFPGGRNVLVESVAALIEILHKYA